MKVISRSWSRRTERSTEFMGKRSSQPFRRKRQGVLLNLAGVIRNEKKVAAARAVEVIGVPEGMLVVNVGAIAEVDRSVAVEMTEMTEMTEVRVGVVKAAASDRNVATIVKIADQPRGKQSSRKSRRP